jgi:hypothetical protein
MRIHDNNVYHSTRLLLKVLCRLHLISPAVLDVVLDALWYRYRYG